MRRWRKLKRGHLEQVINKEREAKINLSLQAVACGQEYRQKEPKNAFLHPDDAESKFPQVKPAPMIDLRSTSIAGSGN